MRISVVKLGRWTGIFAQAVVVMVGIGVVPLVINAGNVVGREYGEPLMRVVFVGVVAPTDGVDNVIVPCVFVIIHVSDEQPVPRQGDVVTTLLPIVQYIVFVSIG